MIRLLLAAALLAIGLCELSKSAEVASCKAEQIIKPDGRFWCWYVTLTDTRGHRFTIIQSKNSLDTALTTCKKWLKTETKRSHRN